MKKLLAGAAVLACLGLFAWLRSSPTPSIATPTPNATVSIMMLSQQTLPLQIPAFGSIIAGAAAQDITLDAPGRVTDILVRPGQAVTSGQALARIAADAQSIAELRKAQDALVAAQAARAHVAALLAGHLATTADLAAATQAAQAAAADLTAMQASGTGTARVLRASTAGTITNVSASIGGITPAGSVLFKLVSQAGLVAMAGLTEAQAAHIFPGAPATITALNSNQQSPATVLQRAAMLDPQTGLVDITLAPHQTMPLGEPLALQITAGTLTGYNVPRDAVQSDDQGDYVFQLDAKNIAHRKPAHILDQNGTASVLAPDLDPAMPLVTTGAYQLEDGMPVTVQDNGP